MNSTIIVCVDITYVSMQHRIIKRNVRYLFKGGILKIVTVREHFCVFAL